MPDILPPQLADVQQRPFYVKVRSVLTVICTVWLVLAIAGYGFFSGGTTSLALSLTLMYGTGIALLVVASALYRLVKRSAVRRTEAAPEDTAAAVFLDTTRSATEELMEALVPARQYPRPASVLPAASGQTPANRTAPEGSDANAPAAAKTSPAKSAAALKAKPAEPQTAETKPVKSAVNKKAAAKKKKGGKATKAQNAQAGRKQPGSALGKPAQAKETQAKAAPATAASAAGQTPAAATCPTASSEKPAASKAPTKSKPPSNSKAPSKAGERGLKKAA